MKLERSLTNSARVIDLFGLTVSEFLNTHFCIRISIELLYLFLVISRASMFSRATMLEIISKFEVILVGIRTTPD